MRTYLILKEKAQRFADDAEIQAALATAKAPELAEPTVARRPRPRRPATRSATGRTTIDAARRDQGYGHERLDQLVTELLLGVR